MEDAYRLFEMLPDDLKREVLDYIEFLLERRSSRRGKGLKMEWKGALRELRNEYTSVELQHKAIEWWG
ncbi:DUF2281 domain-containing protein [Thermococcus sp. 21S7]|uniref:DUF2281 domain-containing protein n=1 Tax=Thermococcus sp. 21S7 TaxID=1638221 RepID=UPI00143C510B|nr:DUF2281 domain-containing protein [Thermococcus sp. 21S7]NJE60612.1 DUF2281 domain-containing protein [Thermococcus sp. 21S7]